MYLGHFAVAFAVKRAAPELKLGSAVLAASFLDIVWSLLVALGVETVRIVPGATAFTPLRFVSYPFSHSLVMALLWGALFAAVYHWRGGRLRATAWLAALVLSHWFLDVIAHAPDLPLSPGVNVYVGLGLWNSVTATMVVEGLLFAAGLWLYLTATRARDRTGRWGLAGLAALLVAAYTGAAAAPPPNVEAIVIAGLVGTAIAVAWAYWVDRHRQVLSGRSN